MKKLLLKTMLLLCALIVGGASPVWADVTTYIFTNSTWTATVGGSDANWTSGKAGAGFSNNGIQVTTAGTGANGTSPISFTNVTKIVATYNTNKSAGAGTIVAKIGSNDDVSKSWGYSGSADGRSANFTVQWDYATPQTGNVKITCNTTTNSIYLVSVAITTASSDPSSSAAFAEATPNIDLKDGFTYTQAATTAAGYSGTVTYALSANTAGATIEGSTVTATQAGSVTVTATAPADPGNFSESNASYTLTVNDTREATSVVIDDSGITNTNKFVSTTAGSLSAVVKDNSSVAIGGATVTWSGDNDDVATINASTGAVTLVAAGSVTFTARYAGAGAYKPSSQTYDLTVINEDPSLVEIWSEDFASSGYSTRSTTYSYATTNSSAVQSSDNYAGGEAPEMMLKASSGTFSATIPLNNGYSGDLKMKFKSNAQDITVSSGTTGVSMSGTASFSALGTHEVTFTGITAENTAINIVFTAGTSKNVRLDDIVLKGLPAPAKPTFSEAAKKFSSSFNTTISSADGTTLKYTTDGTNPAESGTATAVDANSKIITISGTEDVTVKAVAVKDEIVSAVASVTYTYDARPAPTFTLSSTALDLKVNETSSAVSLTTNSDGAVTFSCSDAHVTLTGTETSRTISANAAGTYTVNVSTAETSNYLAAAGTITVTVTKKATTMDLATSFTSKDLYVTTSGSVTGTPKYNSSAIDGATVTYTSSNTSVATVAANGAVTYKKAGSTTITASYEGDAEYEECEASYDLDLVDTTPQDVEVDITLNNTFFGCSAFTSYAKDSPTSYSGTKNNITVTYDKGTGSGFYCNGSGIRLYTGGKLTFSAPTGYVITEIAMTGDDDFSDGLTNPEESDTWTGKASSVDITGETKSGSTRKNMTGATVTIAETVTIGSAGYTTYVAKHDISFPDGVTGYIATEKSASTVTLTSKTSVPEGTAVVVKGEAGTYALPTIKTTPESVTGNLLLASDGSAKGNGSTIYSLAKLDGKVGFYQVDNDVTIPAGKAYIVIGGGGAKSFLTFDFDEADGIRSIDNGQLTMDNERIFRLDGTRVNGKITKKGLYIRGGRKVVVR